MGGGTSKSMSVLDCGRKAKVAIKKGTEAASSTGRDHERVRLALLRRYGREEERTGRDSGPVLFGHAEVRLELPDYSP